MLAVIKLRLLGLKEDYKIMLVMAVLALGMVYAFSSSGSGSYERLVYVTDLDGSVISERFIEELDSSKGYKVSRALEPEGRTAIEDGSGLAQLILPSDFSSELLSGHVSMKFISTKNDVDTINLKNTVNSLLSNIKDNAVFAESTATALAGLKQGVDSGKMAADIYAKSNERFKLQNPFGVKETTITGNWTADRARLHNFFGFALLFSAYSIVFGIGEILNDKEHHTWDRLLQSPVSTSSILIGNTLTTLLVGFIQMAIIFIGGRLLFGIDLGSQMPLVLTVSAAFIFSLTGLGLFLASMLRSHAQLSAVTPILLTSFAMLGGCMWPLEIVTSKILLALSFITPHRWALEALENVMLKGLDISSAFLPVSVLLAMGTVFIAAGGWMIGKMQAQ